METFRFSVTAVITRAQATVRRGASGRENPVTLTFLGETHFVVVNAADIKAGFEDVFASVRADGLTPRTLNMVTGPSRSADIGQILQLGAHGPIALHIFVVA